MPQSFGTDVSVKAYSVFSNRVLLCGNGGKLWAIEIASVVLETSGVFLINNK